MTAEEYTEWAKTIQPGQENAQFMQVGLKNVNVEKLDTGGYAVRYYIAQAGRLGSYYRQQTRKFSSVSAVGRYLYELEEKQRKDA